MNKRQYSKNDVDGFLQIDTGSKTLNARFVCRILEFGKFQKNLDCIEILCILLFLCLF